jgi:hypothetical protein
MPDKDAIHLHFSDLKLLMENYQNVVQLNTLLLEQQKQIIELQKELVRSQTTISSKQSQVNDNVNNIISKITAQNDTFIQLNNLVQSKASDMDIAFHGRFNSTDQKVDETKSSVSTMNIDMVKQHSGLTNRIYIALVGSGVIILALIGMLTTLFEKFRDLGNIHEMIDKILVFFKIV